MDFCLGCLNCCSGGHVYNNRLFLQNCGCAVISFTARSASGEICSISQFFDTPPQVQLTAKTMLDFTTASCCRYRSRPLIDISLRLHHYSRGNQLQFKEPVLPSAVETSFEGDSTSPASPQLLAVPLPIQAATCRGSRRLLA